MVPWMFYGAILGDRSARHCLRLETPRSLGGNYEIGHAGLMTATASRLVELISFAARNVFCAGM